MRYSGRSYSSSSRRRLPPERASGARRVSRLLVPSSLGTSLQPNPASPPYVKCDLDDDRNQRERRDQERSSFRSTAAITRRMSRRSCCQKRSTVHPAALRTASTRLSRSTFCRSFSAQNPALVRGVVPCIGQLCQKHPSTNTANLARENTMSGLPGSRDRTRYRWPRVQSAFRNRSSCVVLEERTRDILSRR
jgi:hypothetical protein